MWLVLSTVCGLFRLSQSFILLICFGSVFKQLAGDERFQQLADNRSCAKLCNLLFD